ncbi:MAG: hypothetical protein J5604_05590 [Bacteroidales bacterium]|nr:hypothetical protein [Bacteroidales bacterium]
MRRVSILTLLLCLVFVTNGFSQAFENDKDSLVRLVEAKAVRLVDRDGAPFREVKGPARFLHNNTYLLCDSASWDVNANVIEAIGHIQIIQQDTYLESDIVTYLADDGIAQFRGTIVKLYNRKGDQLKTKFLDYSTKDSIATFFNGGAMRSAKGDIVEGDEGRYVSETRTFSFTDNVLMYSDSIFVRSSFADYNSDRECADFGFRTVAWKGRDTLYSNNAQYSVRGETLSLMDKNYIATQNQELWAGLIDYHRNTGNAELYNNVQIRDNEQSSILMGDKGVMVQNPFLAYLTDNAAAAMFSEEKTGVDSLTQEPIYRRDTLFLGGDTLKMWMVPMYQVDSNEVSNALQRRKLADTDPIIEIDKANKEYLAAYKKNKALIGKVKPPEPKQPLKDQEPAEGTQLNEGPQKPTFLGKNKDSLAVQTDSITVQKDTTKITFISVFHNVKLFRSDLRGVCDSLIYTSIDSIARFYKNPALWNEEKTQFTADSIQLSVRNNAIYKANLIENAFIISEEDSIHFNQIKSTEMVAYFKDNDVYRFDALGGVQAMIFLREKDSSVTLMNHKECRLLTSRMANNSIERVRYIENVKSDIHPTYNLPIEKMRLRDFKWRADELPKSRSVVTDRTVINSQRGFMNGFIFPNYPHTKTFFPDSYQTITELAKEINQKIQEENQKREEEARKEQEERRIEQHRKALSQEGKDQMKTEENTQQTK